MYSRKCKNKFIDLLLLSTLAIFVLCAAMFWWGGISDPFLRTGKLAIQRVSIDTFTDSWNLTVEVRNTGTEKTVINRLWVRAGNVNYTVTLFVPIESGEQTEIPFLLSHQTFSPDTFVELIFQTDEGDICTEQVMLPYQRAI
ncbi:MAG: hypothetical protein V1915_04940 [Candidatus Bathyarchaeota archaeon]